MLSIIREMKLYVAVPGEVLLQQDLRKSHHSLLSTKPPEDLLILRVLKDEFDYSSFLENLIWLF